MKKFAVLLFIAGVFGTSQAKELIGDLYYNLNKTTQTATVTRDKSNSDKNYQNLVEVNIPSSVTFDGQTYTVIGIEGWAFGNNITISSISIPATIAEIGSFAFYRCAEITAITLPASVELIEKGAFADCGKLESLTVNPGNTSYLSLDGVVYTKDMETLVVCPAALPVEVYTVPSGVKTIGGEAFYGCRGLKEVFLPQSLIELEESAFLSCTGLIELELPASLEIIGENAISQCLSLKNITIPSSVRTIQRGAFQGCQSLESVEIPNSITKIEDHVFSSCYSLKSLNIPNSVTEIGWSAFSSCFSLTTVDIPDSVIIIGESAFQCDYGSTLQSINLGKGVEVIGSFAFMGSTFLTEVEFPSSLRVIGNYAFEGCTGLKTLVFNETEELTLGTSVFECWDGSNIESIYCKSTIPPLSEDFSVFNEEVYPTATLYVPIGYEEVYRESIPWSKFFHIVSQEFDGVDAIFDNSDNLLNIYSLDGKIMIKGAAKDEIKDLKKGLYIINGKKVLK